MAGGPTFDDAALGAETAELKELHAAERELFAPSMPPLGSPWPSDVASPPIQTGSQPRVHASGLAPAPPPSSPPASDGDVDLSWLADLKMPDLPVRWDPRVVRYVRFFKEDRRGRTIMTIWLKRSGRYRDAIRAVLRKKGLPEDLVYLSMIESGFMPKARSPVGAAGLWQFMPETGKIYGLSQDRWADQRFHLEASTEAAADFLADLYRRFQSWDMAMASYNMGYGGLMGAMRRYNTNDYWALAKLEGSLPWETTLYVPKILAAAIVGRNLAAFGFEGVEPEPALDVAELRVPPATPLARVARACGKTVSSKDIEALNPELRAGRTPPQGEYPVKVPRERGADCDKGLAGARLATPSHDQHVVKQGQTLEEIARERGTTVAKLTELNAIHRGERVQGGTVLLVPRGALSSGGSHTTTEPGDKPSVVVTQQMFVYPDRTRVFYRVQAGDTLPQIGEALGVTVDDLRRWNDVDPSARLVEGMTLQVFPAREKDLSRVSVLAERDVRPIPVGSEEFFELHNDKHRARVVVTAKAGDTLASIGKKHGVSAGLMERVNRRGRNDALAAGDRVVLWLTPKKPKPAPAASPEPTVVGSAPDPAPTPLAPISAPVAEALPQLPQ